MESICYFCRSYGRFRGYDIRRNGSKGEYGLAVHFLFAYLSKLRLIIHNCNILNRPLLSRVAVSVLLNHILRVTKSIGEVLQGARKSKGLSLYAVAEATKLTPTTISRVENRKSEDVRFQTVVKIARAVGLTLDEIASAVGLGGECMAESGGADTSLLRLYDEVRRFNGRLERLGNDAAATLEGLRLALPPSRPHLD